ncbi:uncharacterized protein LOC141655521 [Silene latifolia]|uniref:uncharacterized protein LOC141655521 n=1 Tax=Silene latifolia TaxID=37657 RepID=UPI003D78ABA9
MVYAFNGTQERKPLWESLYNIKKNMKGPWVICGDFNTVLSPAERLGGNNIVEEIDDFKACMDECEIMDCPATGYLFTWCNKHDPSTRVYSRLDRVLVNKEWLQKHLQNYAHFFCEGIFYHTPCVIQAKSGVQKSRRSFKYFNMWSQSMDFKPCVKYHWDINWPGTRMFNLVRKLKNLKGALKNLNRADFDDVENNVARATMYPEFIQINSVLIL